MKIKYQGVYGIFDRDGSCWYIGQSIDIESRWYRHKHGIHDEWHNKMQSRLDDFTFKILELVDDVDKLREREDYYIDLYNPKYTSKKKNYGSQVGPLNDAHKEAVKQSLNNPETVEKMREHAKQLWTDDTYRQTITDKCKKAWDNEDLKQQQRETQKKIWEDPERVKQQSERHKGQNNAMFGSEYVWMNDGVHNHRVEPCKVQEMKDINKWEIGIINDTPTLNTKWMHKPNEKAIVVKECDIEARKQEGYIFGRK